MEKRTYTVPEVAEILGISQAKAYEHVKSGRIPGIIRLGSRIVIRKKVLDDWVDNPDSSARQVEDRMMLKIREVM